MNKKKLQELLAQLHTKRQEWKTAFDAGKDATALKSLNDEIQKLQTEADELKTLIDADEANDAAIKAYNQLGGVEFDGAGVEAKAAGQQAGTVEYAGSEYAGFTQLEVKREQNRKQIEMAYQEGRLGMSREQASVISSTPYKRAWAAYVRVGKEGLGSGDLKTLQSGADGGGGFLVPEDLLNMIVQRAPTPARIAGLVTQLNTSRDALTMPKVVYNAADKDLYTTGIRVTSTGEVPASSTAHRVTDPAFGSVRIPVHTHMMSCPVTNDQVEDSAFGLMSWLAGKFNETVELFYDNMILNGSGSGKPAGILLNPNGSEQPATVVSGNSSALTADGLIDLAMSLPEQYDMNARFVLNKTNTGKALFKLKDGNDRYLFGNEGVNAGLASARPNNLLGYPFIYSGFAPDIAADAYPIVFGDFSGYYIVNRVGFSVQVLRELYAETNQQVLLGRFRMGGQPVEHWKLKAQKIST